MVTAEITYPEEAPTEIEVVGNSAPETPSDIPLESSATATAINTTADTPADSVRNNDHVSAATELPTPAEHESIAGPNVRDISDESVSQESQQVAGSDIDPEQGPARSIENATNADNATNTDNATTDTDKSRSKTLAEPAINVEPLSSSQSSSIKLQDLNHDLWLANFANVPANGIVANVLANTQIMSVDGNVINLRLDVNQSAVFGDELLERIEAVFSDWLGEKITVTVTIAEVDKETPSLLSQRLRAKKHADMVDNFERDSTVQDLLARFSGTIVQDSISPIQAKDNSKGGR